MNRAIASSVEELVAGATLREPMKTADSLSGSRFERVVMDGEPYVVKHLHVDDDWIQRATGDLVCLPVRLWSSGLLDRVGHVIDDAIAGCVTGEGRNGWGSAVLLHDIGEFLVPEGSAPLPLDQHLRFIDHMAELHATFWGFDDSVGLLPMGNRYMMLSPLMAEVEAELHGSPDPVPSLVPEGWTRFAASAPRAAKIVMPLLDDYSPLTSRLERGPQTLVHGDWKAGNLGSHPDGRTILLDWAFPGRAPATVDLAWYLAVNCDRLPHSKEETVDAYRSALESRDVDTAPWWDEQFALAMIGALVYLGWSKAGAELEWWDERAERWAGRGV